MATTPWDYAKATYLSLKAKLDDGKAVTLTIDRYLNTANLVLQLQRNRNADSAKDDLLNGIAGELKVKYPPPLRFRIDGVWYERLKLQRVFSGKGSPEDIRNVVKFASRYHLTDGTKAQNYCTTNIGLDCNGFTGNYWGIDPTTAIPEYDKARRKAAADVAVGDAMILYFKENGVYGANHIAVVQEAKVIDKQLQVVVVQSAGETEGKLVYEKGLELYDCGKLTAEPDKKSGDLNAQTIFLGVACTAYFAAGPAKGTPNT